MTALELFEVGAAFGGYTNHDDQGNVHGHTSAARVFGKLRLWPPPWVPASSGLRIAASYQRTLTAGQIGLDELPGVDTNAVELRFARALKRFDIDLGLGVLWFQLPTGWQAKSTVDLTASLALLGAEGPMGHTDRFQLFLQLLYRFDVPSSALNDGYAIGGLDFRGGTGYRGAIGGGAQLVGTRGGFLALMMFQFTFGKGVRNPLSERLAGKFSETPDIIWKLLGALDPVLGADGCVYSDTTPEQPSFKMFCIGSPDPKDPSQILLRSGKRVPVGTHLWVFGRKLVLNDGTAVAELPWLQHLRAKAGSAVEELGHCLQAYGAEALIMAGNVAAGCAVGGIEGVIPFSEGLAIPSFYAPGRDYKLSEGICETATAALSVWVGWGELGGALRGGALVAPRLALALGRGTMAARSTAATFELANQCAKAGYLLANASNLGPGAKKVEEAAARDTARRTSGHSKDNTSDIPNQGTVSKVNGAPPVDCGKQGKHVPGHPSNTQSTSPKSLWASKVDSIRVTQDAWLKGQSVPGQPQCRSYDTKQVIGNNGETWVKIHKDSAGNIHGYPIQR